METVPLLGQREDLAAGLSAVRVLYTDLDGTLLARGGCVLADNDGAPSTRVAEAIVHLNSAGLTVVPISGRGRLQLIELVRLLGWTDFIAEAGAVIVHGVGAGSQVTYNLGTWDDSLAEQPETPFELIEQTGALELLQSAFPGRLEHHTPWHENREATHLLRGCLDVEKAQRVLEGLEPPVGILDNGVVRNAGTLGCEDALPHAYHLVPLGVSKAQAIRLDLAARGLGPEQAAAIGDSATDIEMADAVGVMALVANAFESEGVRAELARRPRDNAVKTCCSRGDGWAEFVAAWLAAREATV